MQFGDIMDMTMQLRHLKLIYKGGFMNIFILAFKEMRREGRTIEDKNYYRIWERRVFQISKYIEKSNGQKK